MTVDLATRKLIEQLAALGGKAVRECTPEEARAQAKARVFKLAGPGPDLRRVEDFSIPGPHGDVPVRTFVPYQPPRGVIVYFHGGGWVLGSVELSDTLCRKLAERMSCAVVSVDYRLAPEHPYPTAVDDCYAALEWTAAHLREVGERNDLPLIVLGDSAGGNLAAVVALRARDRNGPPIAMQVLIYPITGADFKRGSYTDPENEALLTRADMIWFWDQYAPDPARRMEPEVSPICAPDLGGLPPAVILTAEHDVLRDEGEAYATRLAAAGVPVDHKRYDGQGHGFFNLLMLPASELGFQQVVRALRDYFYREGRRKRLEGSK